MRPLAALALIVAGPIALIGCPRAVEEPRSRTAGALDEAPASLLPGDAGLVLELRELGRAQQLVGLLNQALGRKGGLLEGALDQIEAALGVDPLSGATLRLAGVERSGRVLVAVRAGGEVWISTPLASPGRFTRALEVVLRRAPGGAPKGQVAVWRDEGGAVALVSRVVGRRAILAVEPGDPLAAAALIERLGTRPVSLPAGLARPADLAAAVDPTEDAALALWAGPEAGALLGDTALEPLFGGQAPRLYAAARFEGATVDVEARVGRARGARRASFPRAPGACVLDDGALLFAELPAAWLPDSFEDGRARLQGRLALALFPHDEPPPRRPEDPFTAGALVVSGRPAGEEAARDLAASFADAAPPGRVRELSIAGRPGRRIEPADQASWRALQAVEDPSLFALASGDGERLTRVVRAAGTCPAGAERVRIEVDGGGLRQALATGSDAGRPAVPSAALQRLVARSLVGVERARLVVRSAGEAWSVRVSVVLDASP